VSISSTLNLQIFRMKVVFYVHVTRKKLPKTAFIRKTREYYVDAIDTCVTTDLNFILEYRHQNDLALFTQMRPT